MLLIRNIIISLFVVVAVKFADIGAKIVCHTEINKPIQVLQDGRLGVTDTFPWLGLLEVYIRDLRKTITALTGIVFITPTHALASADDVAKMPIWIFKNRTKAMFISVSHMPRMYKLLDYIAHPEYKNPTISTIALIRLKSYATGPELPLPVCWNRQAYDNNNKDHLFVIGFTDEHEAIEKFIFRSKHVDFDSCKDFYIKEGLNDVDRMPVHYQCASTVNVKNTCVWDTGMALVSNSTGHWVLVGFGIYGPGCSVPARFIKLLPYYQWIDKIVNPKISRRQDNSTEDVDDEDQDEEESGKNLIKEFQSFYPFDTEELSNQIYNVDRISPTSVIITMNSPNTRGCEDQIYSDRTTFFLTNNEGKEQALRSFTYKLTLYDLFQENITCVRVALIAENYTDAYLYVEDYVDHTVHVGWEDTPAELLQTFVPKNYDKYLWEPAFIKYPHHGEFIKNYNVYFKFQFKGEACYVVTLYGSLVPTLAPLQTYTSYCLFTHLSDPISTTRVLGTASGYSTVTTSVSNDIAATIGAFSAAAYGSYVTAIISSSLGVHQHRIQHQKTAYTDKNVLDMVQSSLRSYKNFPFNDKNISQMLFNYTDEANMNDTTIPTTNVTVDGWADGEAYCKSISRCKYSYSGIVGYVPIKSDSTLKLDVNVRHTYTTTQVWIRTVALMNYTTDTKDCPEIRIPYIIEFSQWCFFEHMENKTFCYYGEDGYNDTNMPPDLWSKTPRPRPNQ